MSQAGVAFEPVRLAVTVAEVATTPSVGSAAARSRNLIARDVKNLRQIDTSPRPDPRLHQVRIADAIGKENRNLLSLPRRSSAPPASVGQSSISSGHCCQPMAKEWPSFTRRFGKILPIRKCFQRWRNGGYSLSHGSLSWTARGLSARSSKGSSPRGSWKAPCNRFSREGRPVTSKCSQP